MGFKTVSCFLILHSSFQVLQRYCKKITIWVVRLPSCKCLWRLSNNGILFQMLQRAIKCHLTNFTGYWQPSGKYVVSTKDANTAENWSQGFQYPLTFCNKFVKGLLLPLKYLQEGGPIYIQSCNLFPILLKNFKFKILRMKQLIILKTIRDPPPNLFVSIHTSYSPS
jgi:hypothetical protein